MSHHHHTRRPLLDVWRSLVSLTCLLSVGLTGARAQVSTAITPDGSLGTAVTRTGQRYEITGGFRPGNGPNLFHSFGRFSIGTGDMARFSDPGIGIANILSRVTGGELSRIDGRLESTIPRAHFYLLNPSGVVFGPNASLDVQGSFYVSTADGLRLADGGMFATNLSAKSTLTAASPVAFGFLREHPAGVAIQGSQLEVPAGETFSIVGGDIKIERGPTIGTDSPKLSAPRGRLHLVSVAAPGEVRFSSLELAPALQEDEVTRFGQLEILQNARLDVGGERGGSVRIRAGQLRVDDQSLITAKTIGDGGTVEVQVGNLTLSGGAQIDSNIQGGGHGGHLRVTATDTITITGANSRLASNTGGSGDAGGVVVRAPTLRLEAGGQIQALAARGSQGAAGALEVQVGSLTLSGGAQISTTSQEGRGGHLTVTATDAITITGTRSRLSSNTGGSGDAGQVVVRAPTLRLEAGGQIQALAAAGSQGAGGTVEIQVGSLTLSGGAQISVSTRDVGVGGHLRITAADTITMVGADSQGASTGLFTTASGKGDGGSMVLEARNIALANGARISAKSEGSGNAGDLRITVADLLLLEERSALTTEADQATGGNVQVRVPGLVRLRNSQITATVRGGRETVGGDITIDAGATVLERSQVVAKATDGQGGEIHIPAGVVLLAPGSAVDTSSKRGVSGVVDIRASIANLSGDLVPLPERFERAAVLLQDRCAARLHEGTVSSLVVRERAGTAMTPEGVLPSRSYTGRPQEHTIRPGQQARQRRTTVRQHGSSGPPTGAVPTPTGTASAGDPPTWALACGPQASK